MKSYSEFLFGKLVNIWQNHGHEFVATFFWPTLYMHRLTNIQKAECLRYNRRTTDRAFTSQGLYKARPCNAQHWGRIYIGPMCISDPTKG